MIDPDPSLGARANLRMRLLLRSADGPMSEGALTQSVAPAIAKAAVAVRLEPLQAPRLLIAQSAGHALRRGVDWIQQIALPNVPTELRDSFLNHNPVNRAVLSTAGRRLPH